MDDDPLIGELQRLWQHAGPTDDRLVAADELLALAGRRYGQATPTNARQLLDNAIQALDGRFEQELFRAVFRRGSYQATTLEARLLHLAADEASRRRHEEDPLTGHTSVPMSVRTLERRRNELLRHLVQVIRTVVRQPLIEVSDKGRTLALNETFLVDDKRLVRWIRTTQTIEVTPSVVRRRYWRIIHRGGRRGFQPEYVAGEGCSIALIEALPQRNFRVIFQLDIDSKLPTHRFTWETRFPSRDDDRPDLEDAFKTDLLNDGTDLVITGIFAEPWPETIWHFENLPPQVAPGAPAASTLHHPNADGTLSIRFRQPTFGRMVYGLAWRYREQLVR